uniref:Tr-type G domain-containing protein n=1 Tax=Timema genevievae TaxID=629358 RepID=A0A7R9JT25_TIMGE|nr:unnamed protein product [Timema genevievae]
MPYYCMSFIVLAACLQDIKITPLNSLLVPHLQNATMRWSSLLMRTRKHCSNIDTRRLTHTDSKIRNIGILAHIDAGKTTTTERMLFYSGSIRSMGEVHHGNTVTDFLEQERERGITIATAAVTYNWNDHRVNLLDTPGHIDFTVEVEQTLSAMDGAVVVLDGSAGVEAQTVTVWRQADKYNLPRIAYINKMDRRDADFDMSVESLQVKFDIPALSTQFPINNSDQGIKGIVDVVTLEKLVWDPTNQGKTYSREKLDSVNHGSLWEQAVRSRSDLVEKLADLDDDLAEIVIKEETMHNISTEILHRTLRRVALGQKGVPVLCGSSYKNIGVQPLMDAVIHFLPASNERNKHILESFGDTLCARAFKVTHDPQKKAVTFFRIFTGKFSKGQKLYIVNQERTEHIGKLMVPYADDFEEVPEVDSGNIAAVTGLKLTMTGDLVTLNASAASAARKKLSKKLNSTDVDKIFGSIANPPVPVFFCSIEPPSLAYENPLEIALEELQREDPSLKVTHDTETGQTVLAGMGELHLEIIKNRIVSEYKIDVELGSLQIAYKERLKKETKDSHSVIQKIGSGTHSVNLTMSARPCSLNNYDTHQDILILDRTPENASNTAAIHPKFLQALRRGVESSLSHGVKLGCPVLGVQVTLHWFEVGRSTSETIVSAACSQLVRKLLESGGSGLLEPVMSLEVVASEDLVGTLLADLSRRRATVQEVSARGNSKVITALTPLSELLGYSRDLRTITSGTASFSMELLRYQEMNPFDEARAIKDVTGFDQML